jgi:hypothetical protein
MSTPLRSHENADGDTDDPQAQIGPLRDFPEHVRIPA